MRCIKYAREGRSSHIQYSERSAIIVVLIEVQGVERDDHEKDSVVELAERLSSVAFVAGNSFVTKVKEIQHFTRIGIEASSNIRHMSD